MMPWKFVHGEWFFSFVFLVFLYFLDFFKYVFGLLFVSLVGFSCLVEVFKVVSCVFSGLVWVGDYVSLFVGSGRGLC